MEMFNNILNNSTDKRVIKFKMIMEERDYLGYIRRLKMCHKFFKKSELNDLHNKYKELIKLKREIYFKFKESNYKSIDKYIEDEIDISIIKYNILKRKINSINFKMNEIKEKKEKADIEKYKENIEKSKIEDELSEKEKLENHRKTQERMKTYNKEVLRYDKNSNEEKYNCSLCKSEDDYSIHWTERLDVKKDHFKLKLYIDNFNKNVNIKINKSIEDKFIDIIFDFKKLQNLNIYEDLHLKNIMKMKINENKKKNKKYKYTILKIYKEYVYSFIKNNTIKTAKIVSHDIMNSIDNLEYLDEIELNKHSSEDKKLLKYENEIKDNENPIERSDDYKKVIKYLKDNNISEIIIYDNKPIIIGYLRGNNYDNINLETLKNKILKINEKYKKEYRKNREENIIDSSSSCSGGSFQYIRNDGDVTYDYLKCIIKMTEYTPISGGNIT